MDSIIVGGTLRFARQNINVSACSIIADGPAARIEIGTEQNRFNQKAVITLTGGVCTAPSNCQCSVAGHEMTDGNIISAINGGVLGIHGAEVTSWSKLGATAAAGSSSITLASPVVGWGVGAEIMITSSTSNWNQGETRVITAISGQTLTLNAPLTHTHVGVQQATLAPQEPTHMEFRHACGSWPPESQRDPPR
ncbi:MAG: hypothetical protein HC845_13210 [Akkermansiaceae bacterium]|nr:hypothetical protein [Akkermansiaceae bacterium]